MEAALIGGITESVVNIMFVTDKCEIKELESLNMVSGEQLVNLCVPNAVSKNIIIILPICKRSSK